MMGSYTRRNFQNLFGRSIDSQANSMVFFLAISSRMLSVSEPNRSIESGYLRLAFAGPMTVSILSYFKLGNELTLAVIPNTSNRHSYASAIATTNRVLLFHLPSAVNSPIRKSSSGFWRVRHQSAAGPPRGHEPCPSIFPPTDWDVIQMPIID